MLAVDAFSSDAIPVHLITREALGAYLRHVKPDGIVAFHVSNRFLDLIPVVARLAKEHGAHAVLVRDDPDEDEDHKRSRSDWVLVSRDAAALKREAIVERGSDRGRGPARVAHLDRRLLEPDPDPEMNSGSGSQFVFTYVKTNCDPDPEFRRPRLRARRGRSASRRLHELLALDAPSHMTSGLATSTEE